MCPFATCAWQHVRHNVPQEKTFPGFTRANFSTTGIAFFKTATVHLGVCICVLRTLCAYFIKGTKNTHVLVLGCTLEKKNKSASQSVGSSNTSCWIFHHLKLPSFAEHLPYLYLRDVTHQSNVQCHYVMCVTHATYVTCVREQSTTTTQLSRTGRSRGFDSQLRGSRWRKSLRSLEVQGCAVSFSSSTKK